MWLGGNMVAGMLDKSKPTACGFAQRLERLVMDWICNCQQGAPHCQNSCVVWVIVWWNSTRGQHRKRLRFFKIINTIPENVWWPLESFNLFMLTYVFMQSENCIGYRMGLITLTFANFQWFQLTVHQAFILKSPPEAGLCLTLTGVFRCRAWRTVKSCSGFRL